MKTENNGCTLSVYNTLTHKKEEIEVSEQVYTAYQRTAWGIKNNNRSFYDHEIQMSGLLGGGNKAFENFREFVSDEKNPEKLVENKLRKAALHKALNCLPKPERELIQAVYFNGMTDQQYAGQLGISQQMINRKKHRILKKLKELLSKGL